METIIERRGRYTLLQTEKGFAWCMNDRIGSRWYWHPMTMQWTNRCEYSASVEAAAVGFDPFTPERTAEALMNFWRWREVPDQSRRPLVHHEA